MEGTHGRGFADRVEDVARTMRLLGPGATLRRTLEILLRDRPETNDAFDRKHGTDTTGRVPPSELGIDDPVARAQAVVYLPSPARVTRHLLDVAVPDAESWHFVDFGAGKGRVALVAAERPFRSVLGVEISARLHAAAEANLRRYRGRADLTRTRFVCADARKVSVPTGDTLCHFYHPFDALILRAVLRRLEQERAAHGHKLRIVYLGAFREVLAVFDEFPFLTRSHFERCLEPKYSWAVFDAR